jgi:aspartokinase-like uncharacterized kinase
LAILDPLPYLLAAEAATKFTPLPHSWDVTSDSIAARVAAELQAELVLLKSTPPPSDDLPAAAASGYVDPYFPTAAAGLQSVRFVNLRSELDAF